ncbi:MAG TPA: hypothetical protein VE621_16965 [Bryobacteraceae bacterium]|nr:hypothetical protein [Bryobacteraceae bacterium]
MKRIAGAAVWLDVAHERAPRQPVRRAGEVEHADIVTTLPGFAVNVAWKLPVRRDERVREWQSVDRRTNTKPIVN